MLSKVLHLVPASPFGGAQRLAMELCFEQRNMGLNASICFLNNGDDALLFAKHLNLPILQLGAGVNRPIKLLKIASKFPILHLHMPPAWAALAIPKSSVVVTHLHARPVRQSHRMTVQRRIDQLGEVSLLSRSNIAIAISDWVQSSWRQEYPQQSSKTVVVPNGIMIPKKVQKNHSRPFTVSVTCRLAKNKGIEEFLNLAKAIYELDAEIRFLIAGDGPEKETYKSLAKELGLGETVNFIGFVNDTASIWSESDISAFTSPFEPFGLRLIEPIAHGVPVAAYLNGTGSDEIIHNCRGILTAEMNDASALAHEVIALKYCPTRKMELAEISLEDVMEKYSLPVFSERIAKVYKHAISEAG